MIKVKQESSLLSADNLAGYFTKFVDIAEDTKKYVRIKYEVTSKLFIIMAKKLTTINVTTSLKTNEGKSVIFMSAVMTGCKFFELCKIITDKTQNDVTNEREYLYENIYKIVEELEIITQVYTDMKKAKEDDRDMATLAGIGGKFQIYGLKCVTIEQILELGTTIREVKFKLSELHSPIEIFKLGLEQMLQQLITNDDNQKPRDRNHKQKPEKLQEILTDIITRGIEAFYDIAPVFVYDKYLRKKKSLFKNNKLGAKLSAIMFSKLKEVCNKSDIKSVSSDELVSKIQNISTTVINKLKSSGNLTKKDIDGLTSLSENMTVMRLLGES